MCAVRTVQAVAVLAAAVVVCGLVQRRRMRVLRREAVAERLMAGCAFRDSAALHAELEACRARLAPLLAERAVVASAGLVVAQALHHSRTGRIDPSQEGGQ